MSDHAWNIQPKLEVVEPDWKDAFYRMAIYVAMANEILNIIDAAE